MNLKQINTEIEKVNLEYYRGKYSKIKTVEMDMPKNVQILDLFYDVYWNESVWLSFEEFLERYLSEKGREITDFKNKEAYFIKEEWFDVGLAARVYRTWASLMTQIQLTYLLKEKLTGYKVGASTELDHKGADVALYGDGDDESMIALQLKKSTNRRDQGIRSKVENSRSLPGVFFEYFVPSPNDHKNPYYVKDTKMAKKGDLKPQMRVFTKFGGFLDILPNGFVIFGEKTVDKIREGIDEYKKEQNI